MRITVSDRELDIICHAMREAIEYNADVISCVGDDTDQISCNARRYVGEYKSLHDKLRNKHRSTKRIKGRNQNDKETD